VVQNFSGRSTAYTRYRNAATLNNSDRRVIGIPYTRSQKATNPNMAAKVTSPRAIIPMSSIGRSPGAALKGRHYSRAPA
jgi:hypothetical protein